MAKETITILAVLIPIAAALNLNVRNICLRELFLSKCYLQCLYLQFVMIVNIRKLSMRES